MVRVGLRPIAGIEGIQTECNKDAANAVFEEHPEFEIPHVRHNIRECNHQCNHEIVSESLGNLIDVAETLAHAGKVKHIEKTAADVIFFVPEHHAEQVDQPKYQHQTVSARINRNCVFIHQLHCQIEQLVSAKEDSSQYGDSEQSLPSLQLQVVGGICNQKYERGTMEQPRKEDQQKERCPLLLLNEQICNATDSNRKVENTIRAHGSPR